MYEYFSTFESGENISYNISIISIYFVKLVIHSINLLIELLLKYFRVSEFFIFATHFSINSFDLQTLIAQHHTARI